MHKPHKRIEIKSPYHKITNNSYRKDISLSKAIRPKKKKKLGRGGGGGKFTKYMLKHSSYSVAALTHYEKT